MPNRNNELLNKVEKFAKASEHQYISMDFQYDWIILLYENGVSIGFNDNSFVGSDGDLITDFGSFEDAEQFLRENL